MTLKEKAREIALGYDHDERTEFYLEIDEFYIVINQMDFHYHTVALYDGLYSDDEYLECLTETRETIVDAVEEILKDITEWKRREGQPIEWEED